ncbi:MAG: tRNA-dihydrouridine synthase [Polyangia bacterium]|nr:tRNA-dihydrouridine synthase [Polyangia bacterium]
MTGLRIGEVTLELPIQLSPLASITTPAFRLLCEAQGCGLTWTEMVSVPGLVRRHPKIAALVRPSQPGRPFAVQLVGSRPEEMETAAAMVAAAGAELIDLNMGCPVKKVAKTGGGVALMRQPDLAEELVRAAREGAARGAALSSSQGAPSRQVGITVKMRLGWDKDSQNAPELAARLVASGAVAVTVHGRTRAQGFTGSVDLPGIRRVVEAVGRLVPVFGNGDVRDGPSYQRMRAETGCHGVMVGRAALGNPWVFAALAAAERGEAAPRPPSPEERIAIMRRHLELALKEDPEPVVAREIRKHLIWYSRGLARASEFRRLLQTVSTIAQVSAAVDGLALRSPGEQGARPT